MHNSANHQLLSGAVHFFLYHVYVVSLYLYPQHGQKKISGEE